MTYLNASSTVPPKLTKRLIFVRHAEARQEFEHPDRERVLTERGVRQARALAAWLIEILNASSPAIEILVSPATRTQQTFRYLAKELKSVDQTIINELYNISRDVLLDVIRARPPEIVTLVIIGHNPALAQAVHGLTAHQNDCAELEKLQISGFQPANACSILSHCPWTGIGYEHCMLETFFQPTKT